MSTSLTPPIESAVDRFLRYVRIDTQSREDQPTTPSTVTQWTLANLLVTELRQLGVADVRVSEFCMVYGKIPANVPPDIRVPVVGFVSHIDTSPAVTGANVNPIVHRDYRGGDIALPNDATQVIT